MRSKVSLVTAIIGVLTAFMLLIFLAAETFGQETQGVREYRFIEEECPDCMCEELDEVLMNQGNIIRTIEQCLGMMEEAFGEFGPPCPVCPECPDTADAVKEGVWPVHLQARVPCDLGCFDVRLGQVERGPWQEFWIDVGKGAAWTIFGIVIDNNTNWFEPDTHVDKKVSYFDQRVTVIKEGDCRGNCK